MIETTKEYINRILSYGKGKDPLRVLRATPASMARMMKGKSLATLKRRPRRRAWSASEIITHLAECEIVFAYRLRKVLERSGTPIQAFGQDDWQKNAGYLHVRPALALELFSVLRKSNLALLTSIPKKKWRRYGIHAERGKETIRRIVEMFAGHDINHLRQLQRLLVR